MDACGIESVRHCRLVLVNRDVWVEKWQKIVKGDRIQSFVRKIAKR